MELVLVGAGEKLIPVINKIVRRGEPFNCPDEIGKKLLVQKVFKEVRPKKAK